MYRNYLKKTGIHHDLYRSIWFIMRLTTFLLLVSLMHVSANSFAQKVSLKHSNSSLKTIFKELKVQTGYNFLYTESILQKANPVSIDVHNTDLNQVLQQLFMNQPLAYEVDSKTVVVRAKTKVKPILQSGVESLIEKQRPIQGRVLNGKGEPLEGVTVSVKNTEIGTNTDNKGVFVINIDDSKAVLLFSAIGYLSKEVVMDDTRELLITLKEQVSGLDEVVVIGYGTQRKSEVASSIGTVKSSDFVRGAPSHDAAQLIKGKIAGLSIISNSASPNGISQIALRGIPTLNSSASPLVLIDGIPGGLNSVSPQDIEQVDVLKDGSAAAIYGTRGTNGVILITTKNSNGEMPTIVEINSQIAVQKIAKRLPFMNADEYRKLVAEGKAGAQDYGATTDWLNEVIRIPMTQVYNISLRGGSKTTNYVANLESMNLEGIIQRTNNQIIYPRVEVNHRMLNEKVKLTMGISGYKRTNFSGSDGGTYNNGVYKNAIMYNPTDPVKDEEGKWTEHNKTDYFNPVALLYEVDGKNQATDFRNFGIVDVFPIKSLNVRYLFSMNISNQPRSYYMTENHYENIKNKRTGLATRAAIRDESNLHEVTAQYNNTFASSHNINILGGYSWAKNNYQNFKMLNYNFPSDLYQYNNMGTGTALKSGLASMTSSQTEDKLIGFFGRLNYGFQNKYNLSLTMRHEGSTKFGANHKWGTFPSVSAAWNITEEQLLKDQNVLQNLKLRAGYGITGTAPSSPYMSLTTIDFNEYANIGESWTQALKPSRNPNPDLRWEKKKELNIGLDFNFLNNFISGSIDFYNRKTIDLIWDYRVSNPPYIYSEMVANAGTMRNTGIELLLSSTPIKTQKWVWHTSMNYSTNNNKLLSLSNDKFISNGFSDHGAAQEPIVQSTHRIQEGQPIGNFYGLKSIDIDENGRWIVEGHDGQPKLIADAMVEDKQIIGNGLPKHYLNWNNTITIKKFDLGVTMRGAFGFEILNMPKMHYSVPSILTRGNVFKETYDNIYGKRPLSDIESPQYLSYYLEKGNYWKIDNVTLGYTLDVNGPYIKQFRTYGSISNLAVITSYSGIDPEVSIGGLSPGLDDRNRYPSARTYTLGVSFQF